MKNKISFSIVLTLMSAALIFGVGGCTSAAETVTVTTTKTTTLPAQTVTVTKEPVETTRIIIDMAGREVEVPTNIDRVFSAIPIGTVLMYTLSPEKLVARNFNLSEFEKKYTLQSYQDLPTLGTFIVGNTANQEEVLKLLPDIILYTGVIADNWINSCNQVQEKMGVPVVMVNSSLAKTPEAYTFLGNLLGLESKAQELSNYAKNIIDRTKEIASTITDKKVVYYASGDSPLQTYAAGSLHSELIELIGAINAADIKMTNPYAVSTVNAEQLINWNPDVIITNKPETRGGGGDNVKNIFTNDEIYSEMSAVINEQIYQAPCAPFNWFGEPPSVARLLGIKWLGQVVYPDQYDFDLEAETKEFYSLFYHLELTNEQYIDITSNN